MKTRLIPQENTYWCWAASAQMADHFLAGTLTQCQIANDGCALKQRTCQGNDCCQAAVDCCVNPAGCHVPGWPPFELMNIGFARVPRALSADEIVVEIGCNKRPFVFAWQFLGGGGHIMVAVGYRTVRGKDQIIVNDPWPPGQGEVYAMSLARFRTGTFQHWDDFYQLARTQ